MNFPHLIVAALSSALVVGCVQTDSSLEKSGTEIGVLTCVEMPTKGTNLIIHSVAYVNCTFASSSGIEKYQGETGVSLGIDLQWDKDKIITYTVLSSVTLDKPSGHVLAGKYIGVKASAAAYIGSGLQVLVGGGAKSFTLQPLVVEGSHGFGASTGLSYLYLEPKK